MHVMEISLTVLLAMSGVSASYPRLTSWYDVAVSTLSTVVRSVTGDSEEEVNIMNTEGASGTPRYPTSSPNSWYDVTINTLSSVIDSIAGNSDEQNASDTERKQCSPATPIKPTGCTDNWYDVTSRTLSNAIHSIAGDSHEESIPEHNGKLAAHESRQPKPTSSPNSWYDVTVNTLSTAIHSIAGDSNKDSIPENEDWKPLADVLEIARAKVVDTLDTILPDGYENSIDYQANLEALKTNSSEILSLDFDISRMQDHRNEWSWDKFMENMMGSSFTSVSAEDDLTTYSKLPVECGMNVPEMIRHAGYKCETHTAETNDGYLLELHRIRFGRNGPRQLNRSFKNKKRPVVFLQHGILADSSCWVMNGRDRSLPFILADAGCDVWLGNARGNTYSRKHKTLDPDTDEKYWRFTWQHMSQSDLPAMVDKALRESGQSSLYYIGHSQGTLIAFAKLADDPLFNNKIRMMFALGPVATLGHITSPVRGLVGLGTPVHVGMTMLGGAEVLPKKPLLQWISSQLHKLHQTSFNDTLAYHGSNLLLYIGGWHVDHYYGDRLPVYLSHTPAGTSLQNLLHMGQLVKSGRMQKWDYLSENENNEVYGQITPPEYDISLIQASVVLFVGSEDQFANPEDSRLLSEKLQNLHHFQVMGGWDHLDFLWGKETKTTIYPQILNTIRGMEPSMDTDTKIAANDEL